MSRLIWLFLAAVLQGSYEWQKYEQPITIAKPNANGIYEFDLVVAHRMTMTRKDDKRHVVDYDTENETWHQRDSNQLTACNSSSVLASLKGNNSEIEGLLGDLIQFNGQHHRVITINGHNPGKVIVVPYGAEVVMRVKNRLNTESITLHVHGLDKQGLWYTDGVAHIQQCPIAVGSDFSYRFIADRYGTHWYHGHLATDRGEGLLGGFVVKNLSEDLPDPLRPNSRIVVKRDYYTILQDWSVPSPPEQIYNLIDGTMKWVSGMDGSGKDECWAPTRTFDGSNIGGSVPVSALLFGEKGWHSQEDIKRRPSKLPLTTYRISPDEYILLRLVNGGVSEQVWLWLEGHQFTVIAADGVEVKPRTVDSLIIFGGERYDVLIKGKKTPERKHYYFIAETMDAIDWHFKRMKPVYGIADLEYDVGGLNNSERSDKVDFKHANCTRTKKCTVLNCPFGEFSHALFNFTCISAHLLENAEGVTDLEVIKQATFDENFDERFINMHFDSHVDGYKFLKPQGMPYYHQNAMDKISDMCDPVKCNRHKTHKYDPNCFCFIHYVFQLNSIVQLTVYNMGDGGTYGKGYSHSFHMHGLHFWVMKIGYAKYRKNGTISAMNEDLPCDDLSKRCLDLQWRNTSWLRGNVPGMNPNPSFRDSIIIPTGGYVVIRFRATNPGWWFAHCHIMLHHMQGMAFAFRIGEHDDIPPPPKNFPHDCGIFEEEKIHWYTPSKNKRAAGDGSLFM